jgi:methylenetetrahydrofolate reductase (NADPH)
MIIAVATLARDQVDAGAGGRVPAGPRYEILPFGKGPEQAAQLEAPLHLTVTTSPKHGVDRSVDVALRCREAGHAVTLHLAARMVRGEDHLTEILERTQAAGMDDLFVIGGDAHEPLGPYTAAGGLLEVLVEHPLRPRLIGIGAYPEGHPLIAPDVLEAVLEEKAKVADYLVTQLCFDTKALLAWLEGVRGRRIDLPLYLGAVGPIERVRLLEIATRIGVGPSLRFLRKQRGLTQLFRNPSKSALRFFDQVQPRVGELGIVGFHLFTFNDLVGTQAWYEERAARS